MTNQQTATSANPFAGLEEQFASGEAFKREEEKTINEIVSVEVKPADADWLQRRQIDTNSEAFKQAYPDGLPVLEIGIKGLDVIYEYAGPDAVKRIIIPMMGDRPEKFGEAKGRRSQLEIVTKAIQSVFGVRPFGPERAKLIGKKAVWGQHLGEANVGGEDREWAWDVPRQALPDTYTYTGEVKVRKAREGAAPVGSVGTVAMSDDEAKAKAVDALVGLEITDSTGVQEAIMSLQGLPSEYYSHALEGTILAFLGEQGLIVPADGKIARP